MQECMVYEQMALRTGGDVFLGVVGPVRTGKSTFVKRFMQQLVLPTVPTEKRARYTDELPQSGSGRTVTTTEPKFVPEEGAQLGTERVTARVRLVDCVGFPVAGAAGFEEEGAPRLVKTPWQEQSVPFHEAAAEGTRRVIRDHATVALLVTTDGSFTSIPRAAYEAAEEEAWRELKEAGLPYIVLLNCVEPAAAEPLRAQLEQKYGVAAVAANVEAMDEADFIALLERLLYEFPVLAIDVDLPDWMRVLDATSPLIAEVLAGLRALAPSITKMRDCALLDTLYSESERLLPPVSVQADAGAGRARVRVEAREGAFLSVLSEACGERVDSDLALMKLMLSVREARALHAQVGQAFAEAKECGYGIVPPDLNEMNFADPALSKKGGRTGVDLTAAAPSYHVIRVDVRGAVKPALGGVEQGEAFFQELSQEMERDPEKVWNTSMFGKTVKELLGEELCGKNRAMGEGVRRKMRRAVTRIVNEGRGGVICILL